MSERVHARLAAADRRMRRRRFLYAGILAGPALALLVSEAALLRWPHAGVQTADRIVHTAGTVLIVLAGLRRVRDGLFSPTEMAATAAVVTALLLVLVATCLGFMLWGSEALTISLHDSPAGEEER
jgi:hypothetical protein